jgi:hypothetical protein
VGVFLQRRFSEQELWGCEQRQQLETIVSVLKNFFPTAYFFLICSQKRGEFALLLLSF